MWFLAVSVVLGANMKDNKQWHSSAKLQMHQKEDTDLHVPVYSGTWWRIWLRHCATNRKVAGSIFDGVTGIFSVI
jgi:hypothetical protein